MVKQGGVRSFCLEPCPGLTAKQVRRCQVGFSFDEIIWVFLRVVKISNARCLPRYLWVLGSLWYLKILGISFKHLLFLLKGAMSYFKKLTFLKVLTTIAWADGEVTQSELNILKSFYRKFNLDKDELSELKHYLAAPVSNKEQTELCDQLIHELDSLGEREEILGALEAMEQANERIGDEEKELVSQFRTILQKTSITKRSLGKIRNLLGKTIFTHARDKNPDLEKYFKRKVLKKVELKTGRQGIKMNLPDDKLYFICLFGALMADVANIDGNFDESEKKALKKVLSNHFDFKGKELKILFEVILELVNHGFDFHEVTTELNNLMTYNEKINLLNCMFAIGGADGELSYEETEEIRRITKAMRIPHKVFIESKMKILSRLR